MSYVGIAGDWHGNTHWAVSAIRRFSDHGVKTIYQVGDFGIWPGPSGALYLNHVIKACEEFGITLWITPGNHEDYTQIEDPENDEGIVPPRQTLAGSENAGFEVALLPRGYRWEYGDRSFVSVGGAPSIDRWMRSPQKSWWPEEMIRETDLLRLDTTEATDVMLCHDTGDSRLTSAVRKIVETPSSTSGWAQQGLDYCKEGREIMDRAIALIKPQLLVHGHYHAADQITHDDGTETVSLHMDGVAGNLVVLNTKTMRIIWGIDAN